MLVGKLADKKRVSFMARNIPAHAGKTICNPQPVTWYEEHPRARGENEFVQVRGVQVGGTSPRTRGKRLGEWHTPIDTGNIPAHAGKTGLKPPLRHACWEHPRARGENLYHF